jgi:hypothetical protein
MRQFGVTSGGLGRREGRLVGVAPQFPRNGRVPSVVLLRQVNQARGVNDAVIALRPVLDAGGLPRLPH